MKEIHKGRAKERVKIICLDLVKIYGNNPKILLIKIKKNKEIYNKVLFLIFVRLKNSLCNLNKILFIMKAKRLGVNQYIKGIQKKIIRELIQLREKIIVEGSNEENKFLIIFNYNFLKSYLKIKI